MPPKANSVQYRLATSRLGFPWDRSRTVTFEHVAALDVLGRLCDGCAQAMAAMRRG